jgi:hypothetical protein
MEYHEATEQICPQEHWHRQEHIQWHHHLGHSPFVGGNVWPRDGATPGDWANNTHAYLNHPESEHLRVNKNAACLITHNLMTRSVVNATRQSLQKLIKLA